MPLTRYEIRNEYSLANPDLYRAAAKDDPEGLLEGVAMAGLVGIVRQLGDLAEFAAEVFHDLHEEVLATAARGHELLIRVQQLEAELPFVEKLMLAESNYVNFAYNPGLEWHANIQNEQNHFTQGDLPRFIRNAYEDCRGPPRLFLLDKFDVGGAGACLKRYTDPSFFRMEWASSELMKAEKEQLDRKARRIKKKGRRQRNGEIREAFLAAHMQPRMRIPVEAENKASSSIHSHTPYSQHSSEQGDLHTGHQGPEEKPPSEKPQSSRLLIPEDGRPNLMASVDVPPRELEHSEVSMENSVMSLHQELELNETSTNVVNAKSVLAEFDAGKAEAVDSSDVEIQKKFLPTGLKISGDVTDFASETDNYMDALTTIDSEVETDSDVKMIFVDGESISNPRDEEEAPDTKQVTTNHPKNIEIDLITENGIVSDHNILQKGGSSGVEPAHVSSSDGSLMEERKSAHVGSPDGSLIEERDSVFADDDRASQKSSNSTQVSESLPSPPALEMAAVNFEDLLGSESTEGIPETPETPAANEPDGLQLETLTSAFHQLPESIIPLDNGSRSVLSEHFDSLSSHLGGQTMVLPSRELSMVHADEKDSFRDSESEASEGLKESSPHSSANSSIHPMKWASEFPRHPNITLDSDDELDGMQVSSSSSSSSSSAMSSPRPSTLATTLFDKQPLSPLSPIKSSSESLLGLSPQSAGSIAPHSPVPLWEAGASSSLLPSGHAQSTSHIRSLSQESDYDLTEFKPSLSNFVVGDPIVQTQDHSLLPEDSEHFPPPPPLPPLEWRTTRRFGGLLSSPTSSPRPPIPWRLCESSPAADLPPIPQRVHTQHYEFVHAQKPPSTSHGFSQDLGLHGDGLDQYQTKEAYATQADSRTFEELSSAGVVFTEELAPISESSNELAEPSTPMGTSGLQEAPIKTCEASTTEDSRPDSVPLLQTNESSFRSFSTDFSVDDKEQDSTISLIQEDNLEEHRRTFSNSHETFTRASVPSEISAEDGCVDSSQKDKQIPAPPRVEQLSRDLRPPLPSLGLERMSRSSVAPKIERKDSLIAAIASHDKSTLRKVPEWSQSSRTSHTEDREVLLEQIRTGSFSLRRTKVEKQETPRPVANINVAAILEKANAIRQAFAGSDDEDEDDDWSDG